MDLYQIRHGKVRAALWTACTRSRAFPTRAAVSAPSASTPAAGCAVEWRCATRSPMARRHPSALSPGNSTPPPPEICGAGEGLPDPQYLVPDLGSAGLPVMVWIPGGNMRITAPCVALV